MANCPNCGSVVGDGTTVCDACGASLAEDFGGGPAGNRSDRTSERPDRPRQSDRNRGRSDRDGQPDQRGGGRPDHGGGQPGQRGGGQPNQYGGQPAQSGQPNQRGGQPGQRSGGQRSGGQPNRRGGGQPGQQAGGGQPGQQAGGGQPGQGAGDGYGQQPAGGGRGQRPRGDVAQGYGNRPPGSDNGFERRELLMGIGGLAVVGFGGLYAFTDVFGGDGSTTDIEYGDTVSGEITSDSQSVPGSDKIGESYAFEGSAGDRVRISMTGLSDTYLVLTDGDGNVIDTDDDGGMELDSELVTELPTSQTYTIWATSYEGDETGTFTFTLEELTRAGEA